MTRIKATNLQNKAYMCYRKDARKKAIEYTRKYNEYMNIDSIAEYIRELTDMLFDYRTQYKQKRRITDDMLTVLDIIADNIESAKHSKYTVYI